MRRGRKGTETRYCLEIRVRGKWMPWQCGATKGSAKRSRARLRKSFGRVRMVRVTATPKQFAERVR